MIDLQHLKNTIQRAWGNRKDPIWIQAFKEYNDDEANTQKLGMRCRPCYIKVIQFHIQKQKVAV